MMMMTKTEWTYTDAVAYENAGDDKWIVAILRVDLDDRRHEDDERMSFDILRRGFATQSHAECVANVANLVLNSPWWQKYGKDDIEFLRERVHLHLRVHRPS